MADQGPTMAFEESLANADLFSRSGQYVKLQLTDLTGRFLGTLHPTLRAFELWRMLNQAVADLDELQAVSGRCAGGAGRAATIDVDLCEADAQFSDDELIISGQEIMQAWERPLMAQLARYAARSQGDVLEVGFGMGISASLLQHEGVRSYTLVECNPDVLVKAEQWREQFPGSDIRIVPGYWQDVIGGLGTFDGILFDTYPANEQEMNDHLFRDPYYIQHFLPSAVEHLSDGGVLTFYTSEINSLSRGHQRLLFRHFRSLELTVVDGLAPPPDCTYHWADTMVAVAAVR